MEVNGKAFAWSYEFSMYCDGLASRKEFLLANTEESFFIYLLDMLFIM